MIPKLFTSGKSFKTLGAYLLHDPDRAKTSERIRWTHSLNLASDHPSEAIHEMLWTYRAAEALKQNGGVQARGRKLENPVKHFSLNWHPSESPSREHMIETAKDFLRHMGWADHQGLIVCHEDKHPHVHVVLNAVHPETGRALDTSFERRRAQAWAVAYERSHEMIFCEERLKPPRERTPSPTRETWQKLRESERQHDKAEVARVMADPTSTLDQDPQMARDRAWKELKAHQRFSREQFFADGRALYRDVWKMVSRDVREEFRAEWSHFYKTRREGGNNEQLTTLKADILKRQNGRIEEEAREACAALRIERDAEYKLLLKRQQSEREEFKRAQQEGRAFRPFTEMEGQAHRAGRTQGGDTKALFGVAGVEVTHPVFTRGGKKPRETLDGSHERHRGQRGKVRDPADTLGGLGLGALGAVAAIGERLFDGFFGGGERINAMASEQEPTGHEHEGEAAQTANERQARVTTLSEEAVALKAYWEDRRHRRRERD